VSAESRLRRGFVLPDQCRGWSATVRRSVVDILRLFIYILN
jgi:hypothetical protein